MPNAPMESANRATARPLVIRHLSLFGHWHSVIGHSAAAFVFLFLLAFTAAARINVVTLPGRDTVQLTIYNSADLTLVKETRVLTFRKGLNRLEFSWPTRSSIRPAWSSAP